MQRITIDPITRLEGHGKIEIFLNEEGDVANTYFQIPELRGFERERARAEPAVIPADGAAPLVRAKNRLAESRVTLGRAVALDDPREADGVEDVVM